MDHQTPHTARLIAAARMVALKPRHTTEGNVITCHDDVTGERFSQFVADHERVGCPVVRELTEHEAMIGTVSGGVPSYARRRLVGLPR